MENANIPTKYVLQDIELAKNDLSAPYDNISLIYLSNKLVELINTPNKSFVKRDICCGINGGNCVLYKD